MARSESGCGLTGDWAIDQLAEGGSAAVVDRLRTGTRDVERGRGRRPDIDDGEAPDKGVCLIALDDKTGTEIWSTPIKDIGDPEGTPTIDGDHVFAITYNGFLVCVETATGHIVWQKDLVSDFGGTVPKWGYSESPLVDGSVVVCTPGADDALIVALDKSTGQTVWKTAMPV